MHFLWVRWFEKDLSYQAGLPACCLDHIGFVPDSDETEPFGFLDPENVICTCHAIPAFAHRCTNGLLGPSIVHGDASETEDWMYYYINRWVLTTICK